jgi:hypothetical protein
LRNCANSAHVFKGLAVANRFHFTIYELCDFEFGGDGLRNAFEFTRRSSALTKSRKESMAIGVQTLAQKMAAGNAEEWFSIDFSRQI